MEVRILESGEKLWEELGTTLPAQQHKRRHSCLPLSGGGYYLSFYWCDISDTFQGEERLELFCSPERLLLAGEKAHIQRMLADIPLPAAKQEPFLLLAWLLYSLTEEDFDKIERMENDINELELGLITTEKPIRRAVQRITELRRSLLRAKRYYDHLGLAINRLAENELGQIPAPALERLGILQRRAAYLRQAILEQREYVTQVREAYPEIHSEPIWDYTGDYLWYGGDMAFGPLLFFYFDGDAVSHIDLVTILD